MPADQTSTFSPTPLPRGWRGSLLFLPTTPTSPSPLIKDTSFPALSYLRVFNVRLQGRFLEPVHGWAGGEGRAVHAGPVFHLRGVGGAFAPPQGPCGDTGWIRRGI